MANGTMLESLRIGGEMRRIVWLCMMAWLSGCGEGNPEVWLVINGDSSRPCLGASHMKLRIGLPEGDYKYDEFGLFFKPDVTEDFRCEIPEYHFSNLKLSDAVQVEMHPKLPQAELRSYCDDEGMAFVAYAPLGNGAVLDDPVVSEIAEAHGVSEARVSLAWVREKGAHAIPKASSRDHIVDNLASLELELDDAEVRRIDEEVPEERQYDPDYAPEW